MRTSLLRTSSAVLLAAVAVGTVAEDASAKRRRGRDARLASRALVLTSFVQDGRTDVLRNERLVFKFSALVRRGSVNDRTLRVRARTDTGLRPATGAYRVKGTKVVFDPTRSQRNLEQSRVKNTTVTCADNPVGFGGFTDYVVDIPGPPGLDTLKNRARKRIRVGFDGAFRTNDEYVDNFPGQPRFIGALGSGQLEFAPPRSGATGLVDEDAVIVLTFSEPMDINSLDLGSGLVVERLATGDQVPGFVRPRADSCGRSFEFVPSLGFGSDEANLAGWDIEVRLSGGVTDLAGNPLQRPIDLPVFRTRYVAGKPTASLIVETFDDQLAMDPVSVTEGAEWGTREEGMLLGGQPTTFPRVDVQYTTANTGVTVVRGQLAEPLVAAIVPQIGAAACALVPKGSRAQSLFVPADVGEPAAITAIGWGPSSNALFGADYVDIRLSLGHTSLNSLVADFDTNVNVGKPLQVFRGDYSVPQALNIDPPGLSTGYWDWPAFTQPFEWNGVNNLVFDQIVPGGTNCQLIRYGFVPAGIPFPRRRAVSRDTDSPTGSYANDALIYDTSFKKRRRTTRATSLYYELVSDDAQFVQPILSPVEQRGGVSVVFELEGAHGKPDPFNEGGFIPDPTTATGFTTTPADVDGHRFVRFRVTMTANLATNQTPRISSVQMPYQF